VTEPAEQRLARLRAEIEELERRYAVAEAKGAGRTAATTRRGPVSLIAVLLGVALAVGVVAAVDLRRLQTPTGAALGWTGAAVFGDCTAYRELSVPDPDEAGPERDPDATCRALREAPREPRRARGEVDIDVVAVRRTATRPSTRAPGAARTSRRVVDRPAARRRRRLGGWRTRRCAPAVARARSTARRRGRAAHGATGRPVRWQVQNGSGPRSGSTSSGCPPTAGQLGSVHAGHAGRARARPPARPGRAGRARAARRPAHCASHHRRWRDGGVERVVPGRVGDVTGDGGASAESTASTSVTMSSSHRLGQDRPVPGTGRGGRGAGVGDVGDMVQDRVLLRWGAGLLAASLLVSLANALLLPEVFFATGTGEGSVDAPLVAYVLAGWLQQATLVLGAALVAAHALLRRLAPPPAAAPGVDWYS
jgi:hypothetical protein